MRTSRTRAGRRAGKPPYRDIVLDVLDEMNQPPRRTFGEFSRAYYERCAKDGSEPECPF